MVESTKMLLPHNNEEAIDDFLNFFMDKEEAYILTGMEVLQKPEESNMYMKVINNNNLKIAWMNRKVFAREPNLRRYEHDYTFEQPNSSELRSLRRDVREQNYNNAQPGYDEEQHMMDMANNEFARQLR